MTTATNETQATTEERTTRARIPALEEEIAKLREQVQMARTREAQVTAELRQVKAIVRSILRGLEGET